MDRVSNYLYGKIEQRQREINFQSRIDRSDREFLMYLDMFKDWVDEAVKAGKTTDGTQM